MTVLPPAGSADVAAIPHATMPETAVGRVVIATLNRLAGSTGVHTHTAALCGGLRAEGVRCDVVTPFDNKAHWMAAFAVRPLLLDRFLPSQSIHWYRHWHGAALRASLRRYLSEKSVSNVIAQCPVSARAALDVRRQLGQTSLRVTLVCHFNHSEPEEYRVAGQLNDQKAYDRMMAYESAVLRGVDRVVFVSQWAREIVENGRGIVLASSAVIHNGIEPVAEARGMLTRATIGVEPDDLLLINVGTLERRKNQVGLLDLFARIHRLQNRARLLLAGEGPDAPAITARAAELGVSDRVTLLGRRTDVPALLELSDLYVHYSACENCPMVVLEAARAGLPWAAIPVAGVTELQRLIGGCAAIDPARLDASAAVLTGLLNDPAARKNMGRHARARFGELFTRQTMVRSYLGLLGGPVSTSGGGR
jgi:glycosyltransferase involved in cell wall biosynthesis